MSERHGVQEATLRNWANLGYITSCRMGNQLFLDDESLTAYLAWIASGLSGKDCGREKAGTRLYYFQI